jgi:hypothetical protein
MIQIFYFRPRVTWIVHPANSSEVVFPSRSGRANWAHQLVQATEEAWRHENFILL